MLSPWKKPSFADLNKIFGNGDHIDSIRNEMHCLILPNVTKSLHDSGGINSNNTNNDKYHNNYDNNINNNDNNSFLKLPINENIKHANMNLSIAKQFAYGLPE